LAEEEFRKAIAIKRDVALHSGSADQEALATSLDAFGMFLVRRKRAAEGEVLVREALSIREALSADQSNVYSIELAASLVNLGTFVETSNLLNSVKACFFVP